MLQIGNGSPVWRIVFLFERLYYDGTNQRKTTETLNLHDFYTFGGRIVLVGLFYRNSHGSKTPARFLARRVQMAVSNTSDATIASGLWQMVHSL